MAVQLKPGLHDMSTFDFITYRVAIFDCSSLYNAYPISQAKTDKERNMQIDLGLLEMSRDFLGHPVHIPSCCCFVESLE